MQVLDLGAEVAEFPAVDVLVLQNAQQEVALRKNAKNIVRLVGANDDVPDLLVLKGIDYGGEVVGGLISRPWR